MLKKYILQLSMVTDEYPEVRGEAIRTITLCLAGVQSVPVRYFYRPPTKLWEGNVFIRVFPSLCPQGIPCDLYPSPPPRPHVNIRPGISETEALTVSKRAVHIPLEYFLVLYNF